MAHELGHAKDRDVLTGTLIGALGAAAAVVRALPARRAGPACCARAGVDVDRRAAGDRAAARRWPRWPGWSPRRRRRSCPGAIEARADAHALALTGDPATFEAMQRRLAVGQPRRPRPAALGVPLFGRPTRPRWSGWRRPAPTPGASADEPHAAGHQRLPAPPRRHPAVRAQPRRPPAGRLGGRLRLDAGAAPAKFDAEQPFPVVRERTAVLLPTPGGRPPGGRARPGARLRHGLVRRGRAARACSPPACAGGPGSRRAVALTHGHEVGWAALPGARGAAAPHRPRRRRGDLPRRVHARRGWPGRCDGLTDLRAARARRRRRRVPPAASTARRCARGTGSTDRPVVVCVSRLVPRKGQDTLIRALPAIRRRVPDAALLLVGGGPYRGRAAAAGPRGRAWPTTWSSPARCRGRSCRPTTPPATSSRCRAAPAAAASTSRGSASSTWRRPRRACRWWPATPGGAPDAVREGETGYVVDGRDVAALADRVAALLADPELAAPAGRGRPGLGGARSGAGRPRRSGWPPCSRPES